MAGIFRYNLGIKPSSRENIKIRAVKENEIYTEEEYGYSRKYIGKSI